jgi:hypothetical protein
VGDGVARLVGEQLAEPRPPSSSSSSSSSSLPPPTPPSPLGTLVASDHRLPPALRARLHDLLMLLMADAHFKVGSRATSSWKSNFNFNFNRNFL